MWQLGDAQKGRSFADRAICKLYDWPQHRQYCIERRVKLGIAACLTLTLTLTMRSRALSDGRTLESTDLQMKHEENASQAVQ